MSATFSSISEVIPTGFEHTPFVYAAVGVAAAGLALDFVKSHREQQATNYGLPLADPEMNDMVEAANSRTVRREKLGHYAAVGFLAFGAFHLAHPTTSQTETKGSASIVIDASYASSVEDMKSASGTVTTRFAASVDGSLTAANANAVPFSFVLEGSRAQVVTRMSATRKNIDLARQQINGALNPVFQNGESLASGVQQALPLAGDGPNKVIVLASNINNADVQAISTIEAGLQAEHSTTSIYAVVVGSGAGHYNVATDQLSSPVDTKSFIKILGADHVQTAQSSAEVAQDISTIIGTSLQTEATKPINLYGDIALGFAAAGGVLAVRRRTSGIINKARKIGRK